MFKPFRPPCPEYDGKLLTENRVSKILHTRLFSVYTSAHLVKCAGVCSFILVKVHHVITPLRYMAVSPELPLYFLDGRIQFQVIFARHRDKYVKQSNNGQSL